VIAKEAIDLGTLRARAHCVAVVGVRNSAHMGRIGAWAEQAAAAGLVSLHFVNTTGFGIQVAPFGGSDRRLSVNPIALGVPRPGKEPLIHDMSTGTIAAGKVRVARNKGELLPEGALIDNRGRATRDPEAFFTDPPGALTTAAGHKGYGLALFVEVLAGALTGGGSGHPDNPTADRPINNLLSILIDPAALTGAPALAADLERLCAYVTASPPAAAGGQVLLPGEIERRTKAERLARGIPLDPNTLGQLRGAARAVGLSDAEIDRGIAPP
jgi:hydroxycarboxylate dehydrogenase B